MSTTTDLAARVAQLRATPLFADVPEAPLSKLATVATPLHLTPGEMLLREGDAADQIFVVVSGELEITKHSGNAEIPLTRVGPGSIQGEMAAFERGQRMASVHAVTEADVLCLPIDAVRELLAAGPEFITGLMRTVTSRLQGMEEALRQRDKLASLGTLAAGLAHELNNPAAAIRRSAESLVEATNERKRAAGAIADVAPQLAALVTAQPSEAGQPLDALDRSDRSDAIAAVLRDAHLPETSNPDETAGYLTAAGWTPEDVRTALAETPPERIENAVRWLSSVATADELLAEIQMAAERISAIVGAVKGYAYLDQAPVQRFAVTKGLDDTLLILAHKLSGIRVTRDYASDLPEIEGWGSELNQVWTNLLDNAADAMDGSGEISIRAVRTDAGGVTVTICDTGPGIPPETVPKLFEPFFTTKPQGVGTGLGLHLSHNIVVRHGGAIEVESEPGKTCFEVTLPATLPSTAPG